MLAPQIDPSRIHPTKDRILAVQYTRPEQVGSIYIPAAYDKDGTWNWWEVVSTGPEVGKILGMDLEPGDLFRTPWRPGIDLEAEDMAGRRLFIVPCQVEQVVRGKMVKVLNVTGLIPNTWSKEE